MYVNESIYIKKKYISTNKKLVFILFFFFREMQEQRKEELRQRWELEEIEKQKQKLVYYSLIIYENIKCNT